jgi:hypothetical protein
MKTMAAECASAIRKELKEMFPGVKFSIKSQTYSGGNSVRVSWDDGPTEREVKTVVGKYQYGHFNGMEDLYEYTNVISGLPQTKYLFCDREMSNVTRQNLTEQAENIYQSLCEDTRRYLFSVDCFLRRIFNKVSLKPGEVGRELVHTDITAGLIEEFYTIIA